MQKTERDPGCGENGFDRLLQALASRVRIAAGLDRFRAAGATGG